MAPVDIIISICQRHTKEAEEQQAKAIENNLEWTASFQGGRKNAYQELINELEGFKKLFN